MVERVKQEFPAKQIYAVLGGFHLLHETHQEIEMIVQKFFDLGIKKVGPTHCSGTEAEKLFRETYQDNWLSLKTGEKIEV